MLTLTLILIGLAVILGVAMSRGTREKRDHAADMARRAVEARLKGDDAVQKDEDRPA